MQNTQSRAYPLISIIIPAYNAGDTIERCVKSALSQTYPSIEVIVVNDGSTDSTAEILKRFENITITSQKNKGVSAARNAGLKIASGEYLTFVDSDDYLDRGFCLKCYQVAEEDSADIVKTITPETDEKKKKLILDVETLPFGGGPYCWSACGALFKKSFIDETYFEEGHDINEDAFFMFLLSIKKPRFVVIFEPLYVQIRRPDSWSKTVDSRKRAKDILYFAEKRFKLSERYYPDKITEREKAFVIQNLNVLLFPKTDRETEAEAIGNIKRYKDSYSSSDRKHDCLFYAVIHNYYGLFRMAYSIRCELKRNIRKVRKGNKQ